MAGTCIVPGVRALLGCFAEHFVELDAQVGVKLLQEYGQGSAHDASADQEHIRMVRASASRHRYSPSDSPVSPSTRPSCGPLRSRHVFRTRAQARTEPERSP